MADLFKLFFNKKLDDKFNAELDKVLAESDVSFDETAKEIAEHYSAIAESVAVEYKKITIDRSDFRKVRIDGRLYDLDLAISRKESRLYERLCAIDALFADLLSNGSYLEECITKVEKLLNER